MIQVEKIPLNPVGSTRFLNKEGLIPWGIIIAISIIFLWAVSLVVLFFINIYHLNLFWRVAAIIWQTFLYTGLFITAHDAMHGVVSPKNPKINNFI